MTSCLIRLGAFRRLRSVCGRTGGDRVLWWSGANRMRTGGARRIGRNPTGSGVGLLLGDDLDEVAAGVVEYGCDGVAHVGGWLGEHDALLDQAVVFGRDVVDGELGDWDAVVNESVSERLDRWLARWLEE